MAPRTRILLELAALASALFIAATPLWMPFFSENSSCATARSEAGEMRISLRDFSKKVSAQGDAGMDWVFAPVRAAIENRRYSAVPARAPVAEAEARLAALIAATPEPLPTALLGQVADPRADQTVRCVLTRLLARSHPARLVPYLSKVLEAESRLFIFAEAAVAAGRLAPEYPDLIPALVAAVDRARGWGRQYPLIGLELAGCRDAYAAATRALADTDPAVRRHAALYLGWAGHMLALSKIDRMSRRDPDSMTRRVAQEAVGRLIGIALADNLGEKERRDKLDAALVPRLAMFRDAR